MLTGLRVVDLKGIRDLSVSLRPLTVFVGPNGIGKTTLLESVFLAGLSAKPTSSAPDDEKFGEGRWNPNHLVHRVAEYLRLEVDFDDWSLHVEMGANGDERLERWAKSSDGQVIELAGRAKLSLPDGKFAALPHARIRDLQFIEQAMRIRLDSERIAATAAVSGTPRLHRDGAGLPAILDYLNRLRDGSLEAIETSVRKVVPRFRRVHLRTRTLSSNEVEFLTIEGQRVPRTVSREYPGIELLVEFDDGAVVPATHASEGTLLTLAILAIAHAPAAQRGRLILIDDLDRALHPSAQHRLVEGLKAVLAATPELQILATTHSPDLVDACDADDVRVLGRDAEGNTAARALTDHPEAAKWLKLLRVGEFWGTVGEDWVTAPQEPHP